MTALLETRQLNKHFGGIVALRNIDVVQSEGETLGMIGPNGSGKSTFVNVVTGYFAPDEGSVTFAGVRITRLRPHRVARAGLVRTYQAVRVFGKLSVRANLDTVIPQHDDRRAEPTDELAELLDWLKLSTRLDADAGSLTLFEQRRLELAMRLLLRPKLVMLDEPVGGLAPGEIRDMIRLLQEAKSRCSIFIIEHTMRVIRELADRVIVLITGEKVADGPPAQILKDKRVIDHYLGKAHA